MRYNFQPDWIYYGSCATTSRRCLFSLKIMEMAQSGRPTLATFVGFEECAETGLDVCCVQCEFAVRECGSIVSLSPWLLRLAGWILKTCVRWSDGTRSQGHIKSGTRTPSGSDSSSFIRMMAEPPRIRSRLRERKLRRYRYCIVGERDWSRINTMPLTMSSNSCSFRVVVYCVQLDMLDTLFFYSYSAQCYWLPAIAHDFPKVIGLTSHWESCCRLYDYWLPIISPATNNGKIGNYTRPLFKLKKKKRDWTETNWTLSRVETRVRHNVNSTMMRVRTITFSHYEARWSWMNLSLMVFWKVTYSDTRLR